MFPKQNKFCLNYLNINITYYLIQTIISIIKCSDNNVITVDFYTYLS